MIVCIGDSITSGQHAPAGAGWVELLGYVNAGVPGDTTRLGLERFPADVQESGADTVLIQFGHNDANCWISDHGLPRVSLAAFRANLVEMIVRARWFSIKPVVIGLTCPDCMPGYVATCRRYDRETYDVAYETGVQWIDMWRHFDPRYYLNDGLHLNEDGHRLYADRVQSFLP